LKQSNGKFALAYLTLVALPLLALVGVLKSGSGLTAPTSVGGSWKVQMAAYKPNMPRCTIQPSLQDTVLNIAQSGKHFTLKFKTSPILPGTGVIEGTTVKMKLEPSTKPEGCGGEQMISITAVVDSKVNAKSMTGTLSAGNCPACASLDFRAIREDQSGAKGEH
jgi:hypothetical protein